MPSVLPHHTHHLPTHFLYLSKGCLLCGTNISFKRMRLMYSNVCLNTHAYSKMLQQGRQLLQMLKNCLYWTVEDDGGVTPILAFCPRFIFSSGLLLYFWTIDPVLSKVDNSSLDSCFTCQPQVRTSRNY